MGANQNIVLRTVLDCGTGDLCVLDDIGYDVGNIVEDLLAEGIKPTLNAITAEAFRKGAEELAQIVRERLCEPNEEDDAETLEALRLLNPERDIEWYCNCLDTHVYFVRNEEIYREYLSQEIKCVEDKMGFSF